MSEPCIPVEELGRVAALPEGHPDRRHLDTCTRCQATLAMLREFEAPTAAPGDAGFADADPRLRATIAELVGEPDAGDRQPATSGRSARESAPPRALRLPRAPRWRLAWAFAALVVACGAGLATWRLHQHSTELRGIPAGHRASAFVAESPRAVPGGIGLQWTALPGATGYRVVFLDASLREVARIEAGAATTLTLRADSLPPGLARGASMGWEVEALAGTDRLALTPTRALRVP
jgi:hypothetical protein